MTLRENDWKLKRESKVEEERVSNRKLKRKEGVGLGRGIQTHIRVGQLEIGNFIEERERESDEGIVRESG